MTMTARAPPRHSETAVAAVAVCSAWELLYSLSGFMVGLGYGVVAMEGAMKV